MTVDHTSSDNAGMHVFWIVLVLGFLVSGPTQAGERAAHDRELITAIGIGHPPPDAVSATQARAMAERAAFVRAMREAAKKAGKPMPPAYSGTITTGATIHGFQVTRITSLPDGAVEVEVTVAPSGITP
ncbi:MAG: hypothetical protein ACREIS_05310 [Nitrospiraceae bacterium]